MNKVRVLLLAAVIGGSAAVWFRRRQQRAAAEADLWAEATDYVTPTRDA
ncbi:hypothetical protein FHX74_001334 [Friedmanniella endophytica]|uniref:Uncharacterized protein n=1 Tax=Microlunatus kandeliicorticis TaxID=1759536 RepID=A0A7W3IR47_9ACTN|nr:DLW-39 family protein [Microlunatus kandeliicorticis]MBA8793729.1 hypothetical protein [Microlunatus kandeliicorticis]